jgi:putative transposase
VLLAHIRSAFALSNATYGSPRMTRELRDDGVTIGRQRVARLMRENALKARQRRRFKRTTDSLRAFPVAPNKRNGAESTLSVFRVISSAKTPSLYSPPI